MSNAPAMVIRVEVTGIQRSGTAQKSGKPYTMFQGYCHLPNIPYPQKADFYAQGPTEVPQPGMYECDVIADVRDGRLVFEVDPRQGRRMTQVPKSTAA
ncbi:propanediol utilization protein [Pseudomonas kribbensis]|jgi:hypothetical protein|uniref:Propanediol utilization protein n=1 Tax=Pseudomonas kribbensis TaxID=1628086 RepID=A0A4Y8V8A1_9PSED|nr:propanediol utilization protein [Pseudomonas kribbensis]TFH76247.1 propanediol utilization protein [Pseudomonas kribbensis]